MVVGHQDQDVGRIQLLLRGTPKHRCDANSHRKEMQSAAASARQIRGWSHDQSMILHELYVPPNKERDAALRRTLRASLGLSYQREHAMGPRGEFCSESRRSLPVATVSLGSLWITYLGMSAF